MRVRSEREHLEQRLVRTLARTSLAYDVIEPGDRILVAVSGGKDSYGLLHLLQLLKRRVPFAFELIAVHVDQCQPGYEGAPLRDWLTGCGCEHRIVREDTFSVVARNIRPGDTACAICSRMRRGVIYTWAKRLGCNKIALGHHRDDTLATFLMNVFYCGSLQAMPARYTTDDGRFEVIRPMIEIAESDLVRLAELVGFPIIPCGLCSSQLDHKRKAVGRLISELEQEHPAIRSVMLGALKNVHPSHLLDRALASTKETPTSTGGSK